MDLSTIFAGVASIGVIATAGIVGLGLLKSCFFTIGQKQEALITSFGKHVRTEKKPGFHFKWPAPFNVIAQKIGTDLQQTGEPLETKTSDDLFVKLPITIQYEVTDTPKFYFENRDPVANMKKVVSAAVRTATSRKQFQELYGDRDEISNAVIDHIKSAMAEYGITIRRIIIDEPQAPADVQSSFNEVRASERLKEAARNKAEAHKIEVIAKAEAEKTADFQRGEGKAGYRERIFNQYSEQMDKLVKAGVPREEAIEVMMRAMQQDTLRDIGDKGNLVIVTDGSTTGQGKSIAEMQTLARAIDRRPAHEQDNDGTPDAGKGRGGPAAPAPG
jgi:regulator of protease activity HflC (stomatin/prohibitin superfamily)